MQYQHLAPNKDESIATHAIPAPVPDLGLDRLAIIANLDPLIALRRATGRHGDC